MKTYLSPLKLGLSGGIIWGGWLFFMTLVSSITGWGMFWLSHWIDLYPGFDFTFFGAIFGLIYGFIEGFVFLFLLALLYNAFNRHE